MAGFTTLSALWTGVYDYPGAAMQAVPFNADIIEIEGKLSGTISEPNTVSLTAAREAMAEIEGDRDGFQVRFLKLYKGLPDIRHTLLYEGTVNRKLTRITGQWSVTQVPEWTGPFVMDRVVLGKAVAAETEAETEIETEAGQVLEDSVPAPPRGA